MDAVKFIKEHRRMCKTYHSCRSCPLKDTPCTSIAAVNPEVIVPIVEQWSSEHPVKTRQSEFLEI